VIPLVGATPEAVPFLDPAAFAPTIELMVKDHIHPGRVHEPDFLYFRHAGEETVFCDVGANLGASVLSYAAAGGKGEIHSFEINPALYPTLRETAAKVDNRWTLHEFGLAAKAGYHSLFIVRSGDLYVLGEGTLRLDFLQEPASIKRLASYSAAGALLVGRIGAHVRPFDELGLSPTHIKIDAEGAEPWVLGGMMETLKRCKPMLMIEDGAVAACDAALFPLGYKPYFYDVATAILRPRTHIVQNVFYLHDTKDAP
jgi:FkbM family methyltransferase